MFKLKAAAAALTILLVAGCSSDGQLTATGITITRSACPAVAIPAATGDVTLFNPESSRDASAIDVVANITNIRTTCDESGEHIVSNVTFDIQALRRDTRGDREVVLPYFATVVQAGSNVVSKSLSRVSLRFADGQARASATGSATGRVLASAAALPEDIRRQITRQRKPGDADAAIDPMADPNVRAAVQNASFELLIGFQLTEDQLRYNATR
ncbi:hypothetical protein [Sphingosinicella rhizophila]|uniref:Uncharacterized protein n=1 Tax=Sphingosinicella rhizophila TaxID=3050082 RepID=A0ABU3Q4W9_9SPHN|nr:hypothetical protein [Sphingosinicella sp. GR2756]MDT9598464.1 hypothetical protein [Sphingosinicella sp. GR2756]